MQAQERKVPALVFDSSIEDEIGQVLALTMLLGADARREVRLASLSISRNNLNVTAFCDLMCRFFRISPAIGMASGGPSETAVPPMLQAALGKRTGDGKPVYTRSIAGLNDTADPVALIRNALTAQQDQNAVVVLAGGPVNLLGVLALPGARQLIQKKVRALVVSVPFKDAGGMTRLLAEWPGSVVFAGPGIGQSPPFPAEALEQDFAWAPNHPLLDAYRAAHPAPADAPASAMAAVLYAAHPEEKYFVLSGPGAIRVAADGREEFASNPQGRHRQLLADASQKDRVLQAYRQGVSAMPPESRRGARGTQP